VPSDTFELELKYDKIVKAIAGNNTNPRDAHAQNHSKKEDPSKILYTVVEKGLYGLINREVDFSLEPKYDQLFLELPFVKGFQGYAMDLLELDEDLRVKEKETYAKVYTVKIGNGFAGAAETVGMSINQMRGIARSNGGGSARPSELKYNTWEEGLEFFKTSQYGYDLDIDGKKMVVDMDTKQDVLDGLRFVAIEHLPYTKLSLLYQTHHTTTGAFNEMNHKPIIAHPWVAALFDHSTGKLISDFEIVGVRAMDYVRGHNRAAVLLNNSQFAMLEANGTFQNNEKGTRLEATYIGSFNKKFSAHLLPRRAGESN